MARTRNARSAGLVQCYRAPGPRRHGRTLRDRGFTCGKDPRAAVGRPRPGRWPLRWIRAHRLRKSGATTSPGIPHEHLPIGERRGRENPSLDDARRAELLVGVGRRFDQDEIAHLSQHQQFPADGNQAVERELRFRPLDRARLPLQAAQRRGRLAGAFGVGAVGTEQVAVPDLRVGGRLSPLKLEVMNDGER